MKIVVWLGNPWDKYIKTKHNVGFIILDKLQEKNSFSEFKFESKFKWEISTWLINSEKTLLLKPQTYMNLSWESLRKIVDFYKVDISDIIVIYDDMSMDFSKIRFRDKWSAWWHNWIKDIIKHFDQSFKRIKIWIWFNDNFEVSDWVLSKFSEDELDDINGDIYKKTYDLLIEKI